MTQKKMNDGTEKVKECLCCGTLMIKSGMCIWHCPNCGWEDRDCSIGDGGQVDG